jgi:hypothetical protein
MNDSVSLGLDAPEIPLSKAVYYFVSMRYPRTLDAVRAAQRVIGLIRVAQLRVSAIGTDGQRRPVQPSDFYNLAVPAFGQTYSGFSPAQLIWAHRSYGDAIERDHRVIWRNICVERAELVSLCGESGPSPPATSQKRARERPAGETTKRTSGRPPVVDWPLVQQEAHRLMEYHGDFKPCDPDWNVQAKLEELLLRYCSSTFGKEPSTSALRTRIPSWLDEWRLSRG